MKKVLTALTILLLPALAGTAAYFALRARALQYANDCLVDDKSAFLLERTRLEDSCSEMEAKMNAALEEKASLGRNLVAAMKVCDTFKADAARAAAERDKAVRDLAAERAKRAAADKRIAALEKRVAAEKRAVAKAESDRREREARAPLRVEQLKPLDPKKREKSDAKSLDELIELTTPAGTDKEAKK